MSKQIVFCTTCKNRTFHLEQTLPKNLADNPHSKFVILDYGSQDNLLEFLRPYLADGRVVVYSYPRSGPFQMAHAKNMAHRLGILEGADILVNLDADNFLGAGFEDFVADNVQYNTFLWSGYVKGKGRRYRGVSGRIAVTPAAFIKSGGYNERFNTWAPDDKDFNNRLIFLGYKPIEIDLKYLEAIPHGDGLRFQEYPHVRESALGEEEKLPAIKMGVTNFGNIGCGEVFMGGLRCIDPTHTMTAHHGIWHGDDGIKPCTFAPKESITLAPIPTRIFGIGMHKTATTSLNTALLTLGYESLHWPSGAWARDVWNEMESLGSSPTLERTYAASDLPISLLYAELDRAYPGSKFILTIREEVDWLRSVRDHFSTRNPYRWEWDVYPFSNKIHQVLYGRKDFDVDVFLKRYRQHNEDVIRYFQFRPDDLLVLREPMGWASLCNFLGNPIPNKSYPRKFVTTTPRGEGI